MFICKIGISGYGRTNVVITFKTMTGSHDDKVYTVRRLSTPSFVEQLPNDEDGYFTQWRWYFKDDNRKWTIYEKVNGQNYAL